MAPEGERPRARFEKFFGVEYSEIGLFQPPEIREQSLPPVNCNLKASPGIPGNYDANYGVAYLAQSFGKVVRVTARYPRTPKTFFGNEVWDDSNADLRYWSYVTGNKRSTGNIVDGVSDQQVPMLDDETYSIVISLPEDRPASAGQGCGHAWINWGRHGDDAGRSGLTTLVLRNILPLNNFDSALQSVCEAGTEQEVMGEYFPVIEYFEDAADFEQSVGCLLDTAHEVRLGMSSHVVDLESA